MLKTQGRRAFDLIRVILPMKSFKSSMLSDKEKNQYSRHLRMPGFGEAEQLRLKNAHVLVVGLGGLGNPVAHYLAAAGIGKLTLIDFDSIELHNIHRQLLYGVNDCGKHKAETATLQLKRLYPELEVDFQLMSIDKVDPEDLPVNLSLIADCTDNDETRYVIDEKAAALKTPVMFGAVHRMEGQLSLFHAKAGTRYSDVYPAAPTSSLIGNCQQEGVLGPVAGIIGGMMATSIIQFIATGNTHTDGRLIRFDGVRHETYSAEIIPRTRKSNYNSIHAIEIQDIESIRSKNPALLIIDLREQHEHEDNNLGGICRPAGDVLEWLHEPATESTLILYCNLGFQSYAVGQILLQKRPDLKIYHLKSGIQAACM